MSNESTTPTLFDLPESPTIPAPDSKPEYDAAAETKSLLDMLTALTPEQKILFLGNVLHALEQATTGLYNAMVHAFTATHGDGVLDPESNEAKTMTLIGSMGALAALGLRGANDLRRASGITSTGDDAVDAVLAEFSRVSNNAASAASLSAEDRDKLVKVVEKAKARAANGENIAEVLREEAIAVGIDPEMFEVHVIDKDSGAEVDPSSLSKTSAKAEKPDEDDDSRHTGMYL